MANPAYPAGAFFKHTTVKPAVLERKDRKTAKQTALDKAYEAVDARDARSCQLRGTPLTAGHVDEWRRLERHHLGKRSTNPGERANPDNIVTMSAAAHSLAERGGLYPVDRNEEPTERVSKLFGWRWNDDVMKGARPFKLPKDKRA